MEEFSTEKKPEAKISPIHTYKSDASTFVKNQNVTLFQMVAEEQKKARTEAVEKTVSKIKPIVFLVLLLSLVGVGVYFSLSFFKKTTVVSKPPVIIPEALIFSEKKDAIVIKAEDKKTLSEGILAKLNTRFQKNSFTYTPVIIEREDFDRLVGAKKFFDMLSIRGAEEFLSSLSEDYFTLGVLSLDRNYPVFVFKIKQYGRAFSSMIKWEKQMAQDLNVFLIAKNEPGNPLENSFQDKVVLNHDTRELKNVSGETAIIYSFLNKETLVITFSQEAFKDAARRFAIPK